MALVGAEAQFLLGELRFPAAVAEVVAELHRDHIHCLLSELAAESEQRLVLDDDTGVLVLAVVHLRQIAEQVAHVVVRDDLLAVEPREQRFVDARFVMQASRLAKVVG